MRILDLLGRFSSSVEKAEWSAGGGGCQGAILIHVTGVHSQPEKHKPMS